MPETHVPVCLICPHCRAQVDAEASVCSACGMPLRDDEAEAFSAPPLWRGATDELGGDSPEQLIHPETTVRFSVRIGRSLLIALALLTFLALGALGLGYALSSWLGNGKFLAAPDVAKPSQAPAVPESLAPTGAVGPPRLTIQEPPPIPVRALMAQGFALASAASAEASGAAGQAVAEASKAGEDLGKLLRRARRCLNAQDYDCANLSARAALKLDRQNTTARKLLRDAKAAQQHDSAPSVVTVGDFGALSKAWQEIPQEGAKVSKTIINGGVKETVTRELIIPKEFSKEEPKLVLPQASSPP